jgi:hypothetical protein
MYMLDTNATMERTGLKGVLPDSEYDIHCPNLPGPDYKHNYLSTSCEIRLSPKVRTCAKEDCPRFTGDPVTEDEARLNSHTVPNANLIDCKLCGKTRRNEGRSLCRFCHKKEKKAGNLDKYQKLRV